MKKGQIYEGVVERVDFPNRAIVRVSETPAKAPAAAAKDDVSGEAAAAAKDGASEETAAAAKGNASEKAAAAAKSETSGRNAVVMVKDGIPGQRVRLIVQKCRKGEAQGRILEVLKASPLETQKPACSIFPACGGCLYQTMPYEAQLEMKAAQMQRVLDATACAPYEFAGIKGSPKEFRYRNKMEFTFGDEYKDGPLSLGLHKKGSSYDVLTAADCALVHEDMNRILVCVLEYFRARKAGYYRKMQHTGYLRHLLLRRGDATGEILVSLVTTTQEEHDLVPLAEALRALSLEGEIVGILHMYNDSLSDVVQSDKTTILYWRDYFEEKLMGLTFKVTPFSFLQPNTRGAEVLYSTVREYVGDARGKTIYDLFCGTGTISQVLSPAAEKVVGVEIVEEAVEAARENAARNGLTNCTFIAGDVCEVLDSLRERPDVIVLDPPRDGVHPKALPKILSYGAPVIIYVSCKVTSFARDLEMMQYAGYRMEKVTAVDQFANTMHCEIICRMRKHRTKENCENKEHTYREISSNSAEG